MSNKPRKIKTESSRVIRTKGRQRNQYTAGAKTGRVLRKGMSSLMKIILALFLVLVIAGCVVATVATVYVMKIVQSDAIIDLTNIELAQSSIIYAYDDNGEEVELTTLHNAENRIWIDIDEVPQYVLDAFVAAEDKEFYDHEGVDWSRTIASFANIFLNIYDVQAGGSTITQQLIKNINGDFYNRTIQVKVNEIITSMNLERHYTKRQILSAYINYIQFHHNINGVEAASQYYFGKSCREISIAQAAALAATVQSPAHQNPLCTERNEERRNNYILPTMYRQGMISEAEYKAALKEDIKAGQNEIQSDEPSTVSSKYNSYFVDAVIEDAIALLMKEYDYSYDYASSELHSGGYRIYTTMDIEMQELLEKNFTDLSTFYSGSIPEDPHQAAMVIMDYDGEIKALVGGVGEKTESRSFNRATMAARSPGSTIKPIASYAPAFENNLITWSTMMQDKPVMELPGDNGGTRKWPSNYNKKYDGTYSIIDAIRVSKNTIPVQLVQQLTPQYCVNFLQNSLGISTLVTSGSVNDVTLASMGIASMTKGMYLREEVAAYGIFGNNGYYKPSITISKICDADGKKLIDNKQRGTQVIGEDTAYIMNRALYQVVNTQGGSGVKAKISTGLPTIGKTGTSDDRKDMSFMGLTPYYVAGIWFGYDDNKILDVDRCTDRVVVWNKIMEQIYADMEVIDFDLDDSGVVEERYCTASGAIATSSCKSTKIGYYKEDFKPDYCRVCPNATLSTSSDDNADAEE